MGVRLIRKVIEIGSSHAITLPPDLELKPEVVLAASRLILIDPQNHTTPSNLLAFLEDTVEPLYFEYVEKQGEVKI